MVMDRRISRSRRQEDETAKRYGGSRNSGSGNGWKRKNDVRGTLGAQELLIENKVTLGDKQITLKADDLVDLSRNALRDSRIPVLQFELGKRRYVVLQEDDFMELLG